MTDKKAGLTRGQDSQKPALGLDGKPIPRSQPKPSRPDPKPAAPPSQDTSPVGQATALASQTGIPQPVVERGKVLYYVNSDGAVLPDAIAADRRQAAGLTTPARGQAAPADAGAATANGARNATAAEAAPLDASQYDQAASDYTHGANQTLNGVDMSSPNDPLGINGQASKTASGPYNSSVKQGADGSQQVLAGDGKTDLTNSTFGHQMLANQTGQATFAALNLGTGYSGTTTVKFSQGAGGLTPQGIEAQRTNDGWALGNKQDNRQDLVPGARGQYQNQPMNSAQQQNSAQYMSLQDGLSWFARLSVTDKDAYNSLVGQLNHAGYFATQTGNMNYLPANQLPLNTYSRNAGQALVEAMQDLSVAQMNGETSDMASWLQKRSQGYEDYVKSGAGYNPVNRSYQDPATLAATAKQAAQSAIGRNLTPAEEATFESAFHGKESAAYNEMDSYGRAKAVANLDGTSGLPAGTPTGYTMPDTAGEADQYVNQGSQFAAEKQGYQSLELTKGLLAFLKGGSL